MDLHRRPKGSDSIVFMGLGHAENGQHAVPEDAIHIPFVTGDDLDHLFEKMAGDLPDLFRVHPVEDFPVAADV